MPRRRRNDAPGRLHHVGNGGHHGDPLFTLHPDFAKFFDLLAEAVQAGRIRVHAAVLMTTHFHTLIESRDGQLSRTIQWITSQTASHWNRSHRLDGYVHGGRFWSSPVRTRAYLMAVIPYFDWNPVAAGMVDGPFLYPYGSARLHVGDEPLPPWLCGDLIDELLRPALARGLDRREAYVETFGLHGRVPPGHALVQARLEHPRRGRDDLDWLLSADGRRMTWWLRRRARSKVQASPVLPMVGPEDVVCVVEQRRACEPEAVLLDAGGRKRQLWRIVEIGLLRDLAGLTFPRIARLLGISLSHAHARCQLHREAMRTDATYGGVAADVAAEALRSCFGPITRAMVAAIVGGRVRGGRGKAARRGEEPGE